LQEKAIDVLKAFRSIGVNQSILSAYHNEPLRKIIEHFGLSGYFVQMVGLNDYCAKSKVDIGRSLIAKIGIDPEEILFIGDTIHDFEVGCEIGVDCALIPCGHNSKKRLKACGTEVIDNLSHLLDAIKAIS
jgi:phosphoglycolate phosphatase